MIETVFRSKAVEDIRGIISWYEDVAPESLDRILNDIHRSIEQLRIFPHSGMQVPGRSYRRIVTRRYHFKVIYRIEPSRIAILGLFRFQDRQR